MKVAHIISDSGRRDRQMLYEFTVAALHNEVDLHFFILKGNQHFIKYLAFHKVPYTLLDLNTHSIWGLLLASAKLSRSLKGYDVVHTHYHDANLLGLSAAFFARVSTRIYTRHHNAFHAKNFNWKTNLIKKLIDKMATKIVAPSKTVFDTLVEVSKIDKKKINIIYHPFDLNFVDTPTEKSILEIREKYAIQKDSFVIGAVSSFNAVKGTRYILDAFKIFAKKSPHATLVLANAHGADEDYFKKQVRNSNLNIILIPYENDILSLYKTFNIIVHSSPALDSEAFGQIYVESMAMGIPGIFTLAGVLPEIADNNVNCVIVPYNNCERIATAMNDLKCNEKARINIGKNACQTVENSFNIPKFKSELMNLYKLQK